ncbi:MAG TPA: phosphoribosylanthranilate isomerase, partial [Holophaga sp.]|nr:phosphoribosylanthranilate isomerase [Holophaga sp.]
MIPVKICGLTREADAALAWARGASALGFILYPASPRAVTAQRVREIRRALPPEAFCVGVFVDEDPGRVNAAADEAGLDAVQLHGRETPDVCAAIARPVLKAIRPEAVEHLDDYPVAGFLLDAFHPVLAGGTGLTADWALAGRLARRHPLILAGGLHAGNVLDAARRVGPAGLDVCSGVESAPGIKDPDRLIALLDITTLKGERPCMLQR